MYTYTYTCMYAGVYVCGRVYYMSAFVDKWGATGAKSNGSVAPKRVPAELYIYIYIYICMYACMHACVYV